MPQVNIYVRKSDIENGVVKDCWKCPIARAINRHLKPGYYSMVGTGIDYATLDAYFIRGGAIPPKARQFISNSDYYTDAKKWLKPFSFRINIPDEVLKGKDNESKST